MKMHRFNYEKSVVKAECIAYLIAGRLKVILTNEEADELDSWIAESEGNLELFKSLTDEYNTEKGFEEYLLAKKKTSCRRPIDSNCAKITTA